MILGLILLVHFVGIRMVILVVRCRKLHMRGVGLSKLMTGMVGDDFVGRLYCGVLWVGRVHRRV